MIPQYTGINFVLKNAPALAVVVELAEAQRLIRLIAEGTLPKCIGNHNVRSKPAPIPQDWAILAEGIVAAYMVPEEATLPRDPQRTAPAFAPLGSRG